MPLPKEATEPADRSIARLREDLGGRVIVPEDADYDRARTVVPGDVDLRPAAIARPRDAGEVARVIEAARVSGLELAVRGGGHSGAGHGLTEGGIVLDLAEMRALDIDVEGRTAWAETGLTTGEYSDAVGAHGLATGFGDTGSVGLGGITLGGGIGFLVRKHGLTIDSLVAAEVVTADGRLLGVDAESHPDLFWAIRGGGGNFGVATRLRFRLQQVGTVVGGQLMLPATPDVVHSLVEASEAAPEELSAIINVMPAMPMPDVPEDQVGRLVAWVLLVFAGPIEAGEAAVAPLRGLAEPILDTVGPMPYPKMFEEPEGAEEYHPTAVARTMFVDRIDRTVAGTIVSTLESSDADVRVAQIRVLGGAMARVPADATAFAHRDSRIMVNLAAFYEGPEDRAVREAWVTAFAATLRQEDAGAYVNFLGDEGEARVRDAYPGPTWDRLAAIKARYDPTNLFRRNQNIQPATAGT
ncbi:MAG: FAD-binding oxidoreductase [Actinomycetota bacterium]